MRTRVLLAAALLFGMAAAASAQIRYSRDLPYSKSWSIEVGTGIRPIQMMISPNRHVQQVLAPYGQDIDTDGAFFPVISLTGVMRTRPRTEFTMTAGASWYHHKVIQYSVFGTDPNGEPRYNLEDGSPAGWMDSCAAYSVTFQWRHLWNPDNAFVLYTGLGAGVAFAYFSDFFPLPSITPIAFRYGGRHIYGFAELTVSPIASMVHGGLGWHF